MSIRKFRAARVSTVTANQHIGQFGDVFYDERTGQFRVSDGRTPGGTVVQTALDLSNSTANIFVNNITVAGTTTTVNNITSNNQTTLTGVLEVTGNAILNGNTIVNGRLILNGPMDNIGDNTFIGDVTTTGNLNVTGPSTFTGDTVFIGNVTEVGNLVINGQAINNGPSIFNGIMTITGDTTVAGNTSVNGSITVTGNSVQTGHVTMIVTTTNTNSGVDITGNSRGISQVPVNAGVMLHVTGQENVESRLYNDSSNAYSGFVGRRYNGNMLSPTQVLANQEVSRYGANPYTSAGWQSTGIGQLRWYTSEDQTLTNRGGRAEFWHCAIGSNILVKTTTIDTNGITTASNVTANNIIANTIGSLNGTTTNTGNLVIGGTMRYDIATNNATVTQLTSKATTVTANGRTGQITTNNSSLAKGATVTFTVNNSFITAVTDLPIVAIQSGATIDSYSISVTRVQVGSFNITITNNGVGPLTDTLVINFAIMKIS